MLFRDVINLIKITSEENNIGDYIEKKMERQVFANKKSIRQSEFYQAAATGLKPELMFEIRTIEYQDESAISHNGKEYTIIRSYDKNGEITELICSGTRNGVS